MTQVIEPTISAAVIALAKSLDLMAFISAIPEEMPYEIPAEAVHVSIAFRRDTAGTLHIIAPVDLPRAVLGNVLAGGDPAACSPAKLDDAMKEIANIACGQMLRSIGGKYLLDLPTCSHVYADFAWKTFLEDDQTAVVNAEGIQVLVRVTL